MPSWSSRRISRILFAAASLLPASAAVCKQWAGLNGGSFTAGPWNPAGQPISGDDAIIQVADPFVPYFINYDADYTPGSALGLLLIDNSGPFPLTMVQASDGPNHLFADHERIAESGNATFVQAVSTNSVSDSFSLALAAGATGVYTLTGTGLLQTGTSHIGESGVALFVHSAGRHNVAEDFAVAALSGSTATYSLSGTGTLTTRFSDIGLGGSGTFDQSAGTHSVDVRLNLGVLTTGAGYYTLSAGDLVAPVIVIGSDGRGSFAHTGGSVVTSALQLAIDPGSTGSYSLSASATLSTQGTTVAREGTATFVQSGGAHTAGQSLQIAIAHGSAGAYVLSAGSLSTPAIVVGGDDDFAGGAGALTISGTGSASVAATLKLYNNGSALTLAGGSLSLPSPNALDLSAHPENFRWTAGTLSFTNGYTINASFPLGATLSLNSGMTLAGGGNSLNQGTLLLAAGASLAGPGTLANTSLISMSGADADTTILNQSDGLILGSGTLSGPVTNLGSIQPRSSTLTLSGQLTNAPNASILINPSTSLILSSPAPHTNAGLITLNGGTLDNSNQPLTNSGTISGHGALANTPALVNNGSLAILGGAITFSGSLTGTGTLYIDPASSLNAPGGLSQSLATLHGSLTLGADSSLGQLAFPSSDGSLDLANNDLTLTSTAIGLTRQFLLTGQLRSFDVDADPQHLLALGYSATLVTLTYAGDANLNGKVDSDDYALLDRAFAKHPANTFWQDGDFNYDGTLDAADYQLIDRAFALQSGTLSAELLAERQSQFGPEYVSSLLTSIPEPALPLSSILYSLSSLLTHRRRRRRRC